MNKKHIAINTHLILCFVLFIVFLGLSISCAIGNEIGFSIMFAIFILLPVFVFAISPLYFVFSDEYVEIVYNFGQRERIKWSDIRNISLMGSWIGAGGGLPHYVIAYPKRERRLFFVVGEIQKTRKTKNLIESIITRKLYRKSGFMIGSILSVGARKNSLRKSQGVFSLKRFLREPEVAYANELFSFC